MLLSMLECIPLSVIRVLSYFHMKEPLGLIGWRKRHCAVCVCCKWLCQSAIHNVFM